MKVLIKYVINELLNTGWLDVVSLGITNDFTTIKDISVFHDLALFAPLLFRTFTPSIFPPCERDDM